MALIDWPSLSPGPSAPFQAVIIRVTAQPRKPKTAGHSGLAQEPSSLCAWAERSGGVSSTDWSTPESRASLRIPQSNIAIIARRISGKGKGCQQPQPTADGRRCQLVPTNNPWKTCQLVLITHGMHMPLPASSAKRVLEEGNSFKTWPPPQQPEQVRQPGRVQPGDNRASGLTWDSH